MKEPSQKRDKSNDGRSLVRGWGMVNEGTNSEKRQEQ